MPRDKTCSRVFANGQACGKALEPCCKACPGCTMHYDACQRLRVVRGSDGQVVGHEQVRRCGGCDQLVLHRRRAGQAWVAICHYRGKNQAASEGGLCNGRPVGVASLEAFS